MRKRREWKEDREHVQSPEKLGRGTRRKNTKREDWEGELTARRKVREIRKKGRERKKV